jgi:hypothetical protein
MLIYKMDIKPYQDSIKIQLYQWEDIITTLSIDDLFKLLNSWVKFIKIDWKIKNISDIRWAEPYIVNDIESFILSKPKDIQQVLRDRNEEKYKKIWKRFESIQEIQNYLTSKWYEC